MELLRTKKREPNIHQLADSGSDIIAVSEHWLWPFEVDCLCSVHPAFSAEVKTDERLTENSTLRRGCGGVGFSYVEKDDRCNSYLINCQGPYLWYTCEVAPVWSNQPYRNWCLPPLLRYKHGILVT